MKDLLSYDLEIVNEFPDGVQPDLTTIVPSVAAFCTNYDDCQFFFDDPHMTKQTAQRLVGTMIDYLDKGYHPVGWHILGFDFPVLAHYSGMYNECGRLALNSVDMMFLVVAHKGFYLGLDKALVGANLETKAHQVTLNDGSTFENMSGKSAPLLWRSKEFSAVKEYLRVDVEQPLKLARHIENTKTIKWTSSTGKPNKVFTDLLTVKEALKLKVPDTAWMKEVKYREEYYSWIPANIVEQELAS